MVTTEHGQKANGSVEPRRIRTVVSSAQLAEPNKEIECSKQEGIDQLLDSEEIVMTLEEGTCNRPA